MGPKKERKEPEEFESLDEGDEEFTTVDEEAEEDIDEFLGIDENAPDEIDSSGFKTKGGDIPDYEPTVDEVLEYALGKTDDPSKPKEERPETPMGKSMSSILTKVQQPAPAEEEPEEMEDEESSEAMDAIDELFDAMGKPDEDVEEDEVAVPEEEEEDKD